MDAGQLETLLKSEIEWRKYCVKQLHQQSINICELKGVVEGLKVRAGVWGLMGGLIPVIIGLSAYIFKSMSN